MISLSRRQLNRRRSVHSPLPHPTTSKPSSLTTPSSPSQVETRKFMSSPSQLNSAAVPFQPKDGLRRPPPQYQQYGQLTHEHALPQSGAVQETSPTPTPRSTIAAQKSAGLDRREQESDSIALRYRWQRTRAKFERPCQKCIDCGEKKRGEESKLHAMVTCPYVGEAERSKIRQVREELPVQIAAHKITGLDMYLPEPGVQDHAAWGEVRQAVRHVFEVGAEGAARKWAENLIETFGEDVWRAPCVRCQVMNEQAMQHKLVDCRDLGLGAKYALRQERGEEMGEKGKHLNEGTIWGVGVMRDGDEKWTGRRPETASKARARELREG